MIGRLIKAAAMVWITKKIAGMASTKANRSAGARRAAKTRQARA